MTRNYALLKLLALGPLSRREIEEITGWPKRNVFYVLKYLVQEGKIECVGRKVWQLHAGHGND